MVWLPRFLDAGGCISLLASAMHDDRFARNMTAYFFVDDEAVRATADVRSHAEVVIETNLQRARLEWLAPIRHALGRHAEMPLAESCGAITLAFAERRQCHAVRFDVQRRVGRQYLAVFDARSPKVAAGHQTVTRGRADRSRRIGVREPAAFFREPVQVGCFQIIRSAVTTETAPAVIVGKDDDNVRLTERISRHSRRREAKQHKERK